MAQPNYIQKTLVMKPEVSKIFDDLEEWLDYCRFNMINYDPKDLYSSKEYKQWQREKSKASKHSKRSKKASEEVSYE
jgi:hypothetical protein